MYFPAKGFCPSCTLGMVVDHKMSKNRYVAVGEILFTQDNISNHFHTEGAAYNGLSLETLIEKITL